MQQTVKDFLVRSFAPGSTIALLLRTESPAKTLQRVVALEQALAPRYHGWLAHQNHHGANIYVAANPLRSGSRKRTKECIDSIRHLYLDIDDDGDACLAALQASDSVPPASAILSTSPNKYQVLWRVNGFDFATQEIMLNRLAGAFRRRSRLHRLQPGASRPRLLQLEVFSRVLRCGPIPLRCNLQSCGLPFAGCPNVRVLPLRGNARHSSAHKDTHSEHDWAWACHQLAAGKDGGKLTHELACRRADKPNPLYYAQRTIDIASARRWLLEGAPIEDVITMLKVRHDAELPAALCSARAREIAATAQRMISHKKFA